MSNRWNPGRWTQVGSNPAGDPIYARSGGGTDVQVVGLDDLTKAELQELAEDRGLPVSGTKAELIERLTA